jgi:hypothetical protein
MTVPTGIRNSEALVERFGGWPSFHDAEVLSLQLDRRGELGEPGPSLTLVIHLFKATGQRDLRGGMAWGTHTAATLLFASVSELTLEGFNNQNVLWDLDIVELAAPAVPERSFSVELSTSHGLAASFFCGVAAVVGVEPYQPGPESVYSRGT